MESVEWFISQKTKVARYVTMAMMKRNSEEMFMALKTYMLRFLKDITVPRIAAVRGMREKRKTTFRSMKLEVSSCVRTKNVEVAKKTAAKTVKKTFRSPSRTARVCFPHVLSFVMSGDSRLRLRRNPYNMKGTEK